MQKTIRIILGFYVVLSPLLFSVVGIQKSFACDADDALPGALPPAPNGGELGEAKKVNKILSANEQKESEAKLYWEGVHLKDEKQVHLFYVSVKPPKIAVFTLHSPEKEVSDLRVRVEMFRPQRFVSVPFTVMNDRLVVSFDAKGANRFIVHIDGNYPDGTRSAQVQLEEE